MTDYESSSCLVHNAMDGMAGKRKAYVVGAAGTKSAISDCSAVT